jgi:hypothetical protein
VFAPTQCCETAETETEKSKGAGFGDAVIDAVIKDDAIHAEVIAVGGACWSAGTLGNRDAAKSKRVREAPVFNAAIDRARWNG